MIRSALIALGLSASGLGAGSAGAQGFLPAAPVVESCGGVRLVLEPILVEDMDDAAGLEKASDVINARVGTLLSGVFDYTSVANGEIAVAMPRPVLGGVSDVPALIGPMLEQADLGFYDVAARFDTQAEADIALKAGQIALPQMDDPFSFYVLDQTPVLAGDMFQSANSTLDMNNRPAVSFRFDDAGRDIFARYTADNIGEPFAIVLDGQVVSAPTIKSPITAGTGIITGAFSPDEAERLAAIMQGGSLPFELVIVAQTSVDGSDPSADFCP